MKQLFALLSISFFISVAGAQPGHINILNDKPYTLSQMNLHGKVKSITEISFNKKVSGYDEGGPLTTQFDPTGKISETKNVLMFSGLSMGTVIQKYSYDAKGKLSKTLSSDGNDPTKPADEPEFFKYDAKGNLLSWQSTGLNRLEKYEYDLQNRRTVTKNFISAEKNPSSVIRYKFDTLNRIATVETENIKEKKISTVVYTYTDKSFQPKSSLYEAAKGDKNPHLTQYEYNSGGDVISVSNIDASGKPDMYSYKYVYEYDKNGNWTKATSSGFAAGYKTRKIEYYPAEVIVSPVDAYKNAIIDLIEPPLKSVGDLMNSAMDKISTAVVLQQDKKTMVALAKTNIEKLKKVPDLPGNNTKQLAIKLLQFVIAAPTLKKIDNAILQTGDYNKDSKDLATDMTDMRKELVAEFKKLQ